MLISLSKRYLFVAQTKAASTTIEYLLRPHVEIGMFRLPKVKHMSIGDIERHFRPMLTELGDDFDALFSFSVLRDPVAWTCSWFNYRSRPALAKQRPERYTGDMSFEEFSEMVVGTRPGNARLGSQAQRYVVDGSPGVDALVDYERLPAAFAALAPRLGVDISGNLGEVRRNQSAEVRVRIRDIRDDVKASLSEHFRLDSELYERVKASPSGLHYCTGEV